MTAESATKDPVAMVVDGHAAVVTINRPHVRNAVDPEVARGIEAALDRIEGDSEIRAGILTGAGPVFCSGADLRVVGAGRIAELSTERGGFAGLVRRERTKPLIAAVDGPALAGGFELVLACDLVVASTDASFGLPEVRRALVPAAGGLVRLPHRLPAALAHEMLLAATRLSAVDAERHGLVNRLTRPGEALRVAKELAREIALGAPVAVRAALNAIRSSPADEATAWARSDAAAAETESSPDLAEGVSAFLEKREPRWSGD
jgi:enoyl-CoA hydratase